MKLFICPLPPPMHGQAQVSKDAVELFSKKIILDTNYENKNVGKKIYSFIQYLFKFYYLISRYDITLIYLSVSRSKLGALRDLPVLLLGYFSQRKIVVHVHGGDFDTFLLGLNPTTRKIFLKLYASCDYIIFPMKEIAEDVEKKLGLQNTIIIPNYLKNEDNYTCCSSSDNKTQILFMSNILKTKGINEFLQTIQKLADYGIDYDATVAGSFMKGSEAEQKAVLECEESGLIDYLGFICGEDKKKVLSECDFFILPSYSEAFGIVLLEAMASECIIITSNNKYHKYLVEESFGEVFDFNNETECIINFIIGLQRDPKKMKKMKTAARQKAKKYTFEKYRKAIIGLLDES